MTLMEPRAWLRRGAAQPLALAVSLVSLITSCSAPAASLGGPAAPQASTDPWRVPSSAGMTQVAPRPTSDPQGETPTPPSRGVAPRGAPIDPADLPGPEGTPGGGPRPLRADELPDLTPSRHAMRRCYETALQRDPALKGPRSLSIRFGSDGELDRVLVDGQVPTRELDRCIERAFIGVRGPAGATLTIPVHVDIH